MLPIKAMIRSPPITIATTNQALRRAFGGGDGGARCPDGIAPVGGGGGGSSGMRPGLLSGSGGLSRPGPGYLLHEEPARARPGACGVGAQVRPDPSESEPCASLGHGIGRRGVRRTVTEGSYPHARHGVAPCLPLVPHTAQGLPNGFFTNWKKRMILSARTASNGRRNPLLGMPLPHRFDG